MKAHEDRNTMGNLSPGDIDKLREANIAEFTLKEDQILEGKNNTACFKTFDDTWRAHEFLGRWREMLKCFYNGGR